MSRTSSDPSSRGPIPHPDGDARRAREAGAAPLWGFLVFSHGWTWLFWWVAALSGTTVWRPPALGLFVIGGMGVPLGGIVMSRVVCGADGLRDLGRRIVDPRRIAGRFWAVVLLLFPALTLLAGAIARAVGATERPFDLAAAAARASHPAGLAKMAAFTLIIGPLPEEIGWRGYLLDRVQARWNALSASIIVGLLMWLWHVPLFYLPGYSDAFRALPPTPMQRFLVIVTAAILYTWVYNNTGRSVLAVILFHFSANFSGELLGISRLARDIRLVLVVLVVALVVWRWGPSTLRRDRTPCGSPRHPDVRRRIDPPLRSGSVGSRSRGRKGV